MRPTRLTYPTSFAEWCAIVCQGNVVRRGLKFSIVVGAILIAINHGDAIIAGELARMNYIKMAVTVIVPYVVSVMSSVGAMLDEASRPSKTEADVWTPDQAGEDRA